MKTKQNISFMSLELGQDFDNGESQMITGNIINVLLKETQP